MKSLRTQLFASHLALVALMALVMLGAVANFLRLGGSIDRILRDNYASVVAAQTMERIARTARFRRDFFLGRTKRKSGARSSIKTRRFLKRRWAPSGRTSPNAAKKRSPMRFKVTTPNTRSTSNHY